MNELSILMNLLSKKRDIYTFGAPKKEILDVLGISGKTKSFYFHKLITELSKYLEPLGMQVRYNPLNSYWYVSFERELSEFLANNPFQGRPSLAATLYCVIISCLKSFGKAKISEIQTLRNKKHLKNDINELEKLGYLNVLSETQEVKLTPSIGYKLDIHQLLLNTALKLKETEDSQQ